MRNFLDHPETDRIIHAAIQEDIGPGDYTTLSTIPAAATSSGRCLIKDKGILAGVALAERVFHTIDPTLTVETYQQDGDAVSHGDIAFLVQGKVRSILQAERLVLNLMQRMSGIATFAHEVSSLLSGLPCKVLDTRKTTPLIRHVEKWAVHIGGGTNHRFGLYDMVMIKDNHVDYAGGITEAVQACRAYLTAHDLHLRIEVETRSLEEVQEVLATGEADVIMLDNMSLDMMREAVGMIGDQAQTEASGGITLETARVIAETGVDYISMGALTHSVKSLDISLKAVR
ncbi:MAG: carboxylating nicotinate-nucleotide diphosphorylase [Bacteroidota bacterium]